MCASLLAPGSDSAGRRVVCRKEGDIAGRNIGYSNERIESLPPERRPRTLRLLTGHSAGFRRVYKSGLG